MRIAIITKSMAIKGGIERFVQTMSNYWAEIERHSVVIITSDSSESCYALNEAIRVIKIDGQPSRNAIISKFPSLNYHFHYVRDYISQIQNFCTLWKPDVIISQMQGQDNLLLSKVPFTNNIPVIGVSHITCKSRFSDFYHSSSLLQKAKRNINNKKIISNISKYDAIVSISREDMFILKHKYHCNSVYIPNSNTFDSYSMPRANNKRIIMVGRFDYLKGQDRLLKIWSSIAPKYLNWSLMLVGNGSTHDSMTRLSQNLSISKQVEFIPYSDEVEKLLQTSSICAFASREESFGLAITEALQCGLPTVAFDCNCGPKDILTNYYNGFLIDDDNEQEFANKLELLITDAGLRTELSKNAIESVKRFDKRVVMNQWDELLNNVISSKQKRLSTRNQSL